MKDPRDVLAEGRRASDPALLMPAAVGAWEDHYRRVTRELVPLLCDEIERLRDGLAENAGELERKDEALRHVAHELRANFEVLAGKDYAKRAYLGQLAGVLEEALAEPPRPPGLRAGRRGGGGVSEEEAREKMLASTAWCGEEEGRMLMSVDAAAWYEWMAFVRPDDRKGGA